LASIYPSSFFFFPGEGFSKIRPTRLRHFSPRPAEEDILGFFLVQPVLVPPLLESFSFNVRATGSVYLFSAPSSLFPLPFYHMTATPPPSQSYFPPMKGSVSVFPFFPFSSCGASFVRGDGIFTNEQAQILFPFPSSSLLLFPRGPSGALFPPLFF